MGIVIDKIVGELFHNHALELVTSDPVSAKNGSQIFNTTDNTLKMYYDGVWYTLHTLSVDKLLLETGDFILLETGDRILLES